MTSLVRELTPAPIPLSLSTTMTSRPASARAAETDDARANDETLDRFHPNSLLQAERSSALILQPAKRILAKTGRRSRIVALVKLNSNTPRGRLFESRWRRSLKREKSTRNKSLPDPPK
jgi:hypothetical protein